MIGDQYATTHGDASDVNRDVIDVCVLACVMESVVERR